jgi:UDPglucose 6-dehydrogenase
MAEVGNDVLCVDIDADKIQQLLDGQIPIHEPGLAEIVSRNAAAGRLNFTTDIDLGVQHGILQIIAVGTPPGEDGSADLQHVLAVAKSVGQRIDEYKVIVDKSTVPVGTAEKVQAEIAKALAERGTEVDFDVVSNPEFLKEGGAIADFMKPDRIVIGSQSGRATELIRTLYKPFSRNHEKLILMDIPSAELTKYAANAMLATKISFMNELSNLAELCGADIEQVRLGMGSDPRIGFEFIYPGCGYGGSCFPKDVTALAKSAKQLDYHAELIHAVENVNNRQKQVLFNKIGQHFGKLFNKIGQHFGNDLTGRTIAVWGLAFKPNTDDMREAPSRVLMEAVWAAGGRIRAYDPEAMEEARRIYGERTDLVLCDSAREAIAGADALAVVTEWQEFRSPDFDFILEQMSEPVIFDGRNIYDPDNMASLGFTHYGIGRAARRLGAS